MDTRTVLLIAAAAWLLVSHAGDLFDAAKGLLAWFVGLFGRPELSLDHDAAKADQAATSPVCDLVASFLRLRPHLSKEQATASWAVLAPAEEYRYREADYQNQQDVSAALKLVSAWTLLKPYLTADQARATWSMLELALPAVEQAKEAAKP